MIPRKKMHFLVGTTMAWSKRESITPPRLSHFAPAPDIVGFGHLRFDKVFYPRGTDQPGIRYWHALATDRGPVH
jgi:hypothetical protein